MTEKWRWGIAAAVLALFVQAQPAPAQTEWTDLRKAPSRPASGVKPRLRIQADPLQPAIQEPRVLAGAHVPGGPAAWEQIAGSISALCLEMNPMPHDL